MMADKITDDTPAMLRMKAEGNRGAFFSSHIIDVASESKNGLYLKLYPALHL